MTRQSFIESSQSLLYRQVILRVPEMVVKVYGEALSRLNLIQDFPSVDVV